MSNPLANRTVQKLMTNKSGGTLNQGDVVIVDSSTALSITTTTTSGYKNGKVGVVIEPNGIANNAVGMIAFEGWVPKINLSSSASLGDLVKTHTVAGQGVRHAAPLVAGDFAQVLETGTSPEAILLGHIEQGAGASGAPTDAEYVTTAANGSLSAEVNIPGLAGSPDRSGIGGSGGASEEWDTSTTNITWDSAPATVDSDTTVPSHLYIRHTATTEIFGTKAWVPGSGAFNAIVKVALSTEGTGNQNHQIGLHIQDSGNTNRTLLQLSVNPSTMAALINAHTYASGSYTQRGSSWSNLGYLSRYVYFKTSRDGSNNVSFYFSLNGLSWQFIASVSFTFTVAKIGFRVAGGAGSSAFQCIADFLRTDV